MTATSLTRDFELPGRSLAYGRAGMAATSHTAATAVALDILKAGGNAMDAAIAACAMQCVVEPGSTGVGGDCFAMMARAGSASDLVAYNGSGRTPGALTLEGVLADGVQEIAQHSALAVTVPGSVEAWARLARDHGTLPLAVLLAPAIDMARAGFVVTPRVAYDLGRANGLLRRDPSSAATFLLDGEAPAAGTILFQPRLADTLEAIGREGSRAFYEGDIAADILAHLKALGGLHQARDFSTAAGEYVQPVSTEFRGRTVFELPPNGQGVVALMILNILSRFTPKPDPLDVDNLHIEIEATRLAYAARDAWLADPAMATVDVDGLLSEAMADRLAEQIDLSRAIDPLPDFSPGGIHRDTVYISVVDRDRNCVSFINSLFHGFGSGIMAPRSGVLLHNRGQSFSLTPGHPNALAPGKRPMHTIIPGMAGRDGRIDLVFGVMGGHYQAMGHAHLLAKLYDHDMDLQSAIDLPRVFPIPGSRCDVEMEAGSHAAVGASLAARGFEVQRARSPIGGAQAIGIDWDTGVLRGGSDPRKDGCALGY